jgi:muconate cycloisomerase
MPEDLTAAAPDLARDLVIAAVRSTIVDVPTVRRHKLSQTDLAPL